MVLVFKHCLLYGVNCVLCHLTEQLKSFLLMTSTAQGKEVFSPGLGRTFALHFKMFALFQEDIRIS